MFRERCTLHSLLRIDIINAIFVATAALLITSCSKPPTPEPNSTPVPTPVSTPVLTPASPPPIPTPSPITRRVAPPGVYFAIQRLSVTTSDGIRGFAPGTRLTLIKDLGNQLRVTTGAFEIEVFPSEVTNDLDIAALAAQQYAQGQQSIELQKQKAAMDEANRAAAVAKSRPEATQTTIVVHPRSTPYQNYNERQRSQGLNGSAYDRHYNRW